MKTMQMNWGITFHKMSAPVECMSAVGTLRRDAAGHITGVDLKLHRRLSIEEKNESTARRLSCAKKLMYKIFEDMRGEHVVISVLKELIGNKAPTILITDCAGNVAGNSQGFGMNVWSGENHAKALNAFIGKPTFISMQVDATPVRSTPHKKQVHAKFKYKPAYHVRYAKSKA